MVYALLLKWQLFGFFVFWFGIGALLSMIVSIFAPENIILQCTVFVISSVILLLLTKPIVNKFTKKDKILETNAYSIISKKAIVTQSINNTLGVGQIKISNEVWSAKTESDVTLEKGTEVKIIRIDGVKAVVEPISVNLQITK